MFLLTPEAEKAIFDAERYLSNEKGDKGKVLREQARNSVLLAANSIREKNVGQEDCQNLIDTLASLMLAAHKAGIDFDNCLSLAICLATDHFEFEAG